MMNVARAAPTGTLPYATTYRAFAPTDLRTHLRHAALSVWSAGYHRLPAYAQALRRPRIQFIYLHWVFADEEEPFRCLIEWLAASNHTFASYSEAVDRVVGGVIDRPIVCFSFDDGVDNCLQAGRILAEFGISACFFLNTALLDDRPVIHDTWITLNRSGRQPLRYLSWRDAEELRTLGHEIGGHTHSHVNLAAAPLSQVQEEIALNRALLEKRLGPLQHFAWPFGRFRFFSAEARKAVFAAGFRTCASAERGAHVVRTDNAGFCIRRDGIVAAWPLAHIQTLLAYSAARAGAGDNEWPRWEISA